MKIVVVWLFFLTEASSFPTELPSNAKEEKPCCVGPPRLLFKGHDSKHGINVYLFEFPPLKRGPKVKDESTVHSNRTSEDLLSTTEEKTPNEPAKSETNTLPNPHIIDIIPQAIRPFTTTVSLNTGRTKTISVFNSNPRIARNDTEKHGKVKKTDITVGDEARHTNVGAIQEDNDVDGYYSTEGITLTDISGYSDNKGTKEHPNVRLPSTDIEIDNMNKSRYKEHSQDTQSPTHSKGHYPKRKSHNPNKHVTVSSMNQPSKADGRHETLVTHRDNQQPAHAKTTNKQSPKTHSTSRNAIYRRKQRQRYAHYHSRQSQHRYRHHSKHSSSESTSTSTSDSSQQFG